MPQKTRIKELLNCFLEEIELWTFVERRVGAVLGVPVALPGPPAGRGQLLFQRQRPRYLR